MCILFNRSQKGDVVISHRVYDKNELIQVAEPVVLSKKVKVTVPEGFNAAVTVNNDKDHLCRLDPCVELKLLERLGKTYKGKQVKIVYYPESVGTIRAGWGIGGLHVRNDKLLQDYTVGANGSFTVEIDNYKALMHEFPDKKSVTLDDVKGKISSSFNERAKKILADYFANDNVSVFEINTYIQDFSEKLKEAMKYNEDFSKYGVKLDTVNVAGFYVPEEDIERIRNNE